MSEWRDHYSFMCPKCNYTTKSLASEVCEEIEKHYNCYGNPTGSVSTKYYMVCVACKSKIYLKKEDHEYYVPVCKIFERLVEDPKLNTNADDANANADAEAEVEVEYCRCDKKITDYYYQLIPGGGPKYCNRICFEDHH